MKISKPRKAKWPTGTRVKKIRGSQWHGQVVGYYSSSLTDVGYAVESAFAKGSVQIYPESALELWTNENG